jgi:uncharacterized protein YpmB
MKRNQKIVLVLVLLIILYAFASGLIKKAIIYTNAKYKENISDIELIKDSIRGKPLTLVIGRDIEGDRVAVWMNLRHSYFKPVVEGRVNLQNTITSEMAEKIVIDNKLMDDIHNIQLDYYSNPNFPLVEGAYWSLRDEDFLVAYVDIHTGEYYLYNEKTAEYINK